MENFNGLNSLDEGLENDLYESSLEEDLDETIGENPEEDTFGEVVMDDEGDDPDEIADMDFFDDTDDL